MSVSYRAEVIAGLRIERKYLYVDKTVAGCEHSVPSTAKFCPECGVKAGKIEHVPIEGFDEDEEYRDLVVGRIMGYENDPLEGEVVIGVSVVATNFDTWDGSDPADCTSLDKIQGALNVAAAALEQMPPEISERGTFGIWLVPNCG